MDNGDSSEIELWQASRRGDRETVKEALANGADVNWKNPTSKVSTCIMSAAVNNVIYCSFELVFILLLPMSTKESLKNY